MLVRSMSCAVAPGCLLSHVQAGQELPERRGHSARAWRALVAQTLDVDASGGQDVLEGARQARLAWLIRAVPPASPRRMTSRSGPVASRAAGHHRLLPCGDRMLPRERP